MNHQAPHFTFVEYNSGLLVIMQAELFRLIGWRCQVTNLGLRIDLSSWQSLMDNTGVEFEMGE
jgi:hypothetical protein